MLFNPAVEFATTKELITAIRSKTVKLAEGRSKKGKSLLDKIFKSLRFFCFSKSILSAVLHLNILKIIL